MARGIRRGRSPLLHATETLEDESQRTQSVSGILAARLVTPMQGRCLKKLRGVVSKKPGAPLSGFVTGGLIFLVCFLTLPFSGQPKGQIKGTATTGAIPRDFPLKQQSSHRDGDPTMVAQKEVFSGRIWEHYSSITRVRDDTHEKDIFHRDPLFPGGGQ